MTKLKYIGRVWFRKRRLFANSDRFAVTNGPSGGPFAKCSLLRNVALDDLKGKEKSCGVVRLNFAPKAIGRPPFSPRRINPESLSGCMPSADPPQGGLRRELQSA